MSLRYSKLALPKTRYLPGHTARPQEPLAVLALTEDLITVSNWHDTQTYLYAIDLFNYKFWWETHEVLEDCWKAVGKQTSPVGMFLQGIIEVAAACLKREVQEMHPMQRLMAAGLAKLETQTGVYLGVDCIDLIQQSQEYREGSRLMPPVIKLNF